MNEKMPLDVRKYNARSMFIFTKRQFVLLSACVVVSLFLYSILKNTSLEQAIIAVIIIPIDTCILAFMIKIYDYIPLEEYLMKIFRWTTSNKQMSFVKKAEKIKQDSTSKKKDKKEGYL